MESPSITTKFSTRLKKVLSSAEETAESLHHNVVDTDHLLFALRIYKGSVAAEILAASHIKVETLRSEVINNHELQKSTSAKKILYTGQAKRALIKATWTAGQNQHHFVGTEHLLSALVNQREGAAKKSLANLKVNVSKIKTQLKLVLKGTTHFPDITETLHLRAAPPSNRSKNQTPLLSKFALDLNQRALELKTDPVIGREEEIERLIDVLERRNKNNAVLVGEPGVGKTAIVEGLAHLIISGQVPTALATKRIFQIDITSLVAGTSYRGEYEDRLKRLMAEVEKLGNAIIFIDELHTIVGSGNVGGALDTANMLKTTLARGEVKVIGATTPAEYKAHIEPDAALERRFQLVSVPEVSAAQALKILKGLTPLYERFHGVKLSPKVISSAIEWSQRYVPERFLPDKAIDIIDEALSRKKVSAMKTGQESVEFKERERFGALALETEQLILAERYKEALQKKARLARLSVRLKRQDQTKVNKPSDLSINELDIAKVISRMSQVPVEQITNTDSQRLVDLAKNLQKRVVGQLPAIKVISDTLLRARAGLQDPNRPLGTFLFMGPSGVGKTELAKSLAENVFLAKKALIRIDMSEFTEKFNVSRLIGSPPGYVGYGEGGRLTEAVRKQPYSVVLFDEIEKAHPDVAQILLQIFEDGQLTDAAGKIVNFKNTICILTSNIGNRYTGQGEVIGFDKGDSGHEPGVKSNGQAAAKTTASDTKTAFDTTVSGTKTAFDTKTAEIKKTLQKHFRPELLGRLDKVVVFSPLDEAALRKIFKLEFAKVRARLKGRVKNITLSPEIIEAAIKQRDPDSGARFIRNFIQEYVEPKLAYHVMSAKTKTDIKLEWLDQAVTVRPLKK